MLENGLTFGCLTIISNDFQLNHNAILQSIEPLALKEWNRFDDWRDWRIWDEKTNKFDTYYKLNKTETKLFNNKSSMPNSFIEKFLFTELRQEEEEPYGWKITDKLNILYHKKNPNTKSNFIKSLINREMYEVKCNICGRTYFMDEESITCVKWRSCVGSACLSSTVSNEDITYTNLCKVDNQSDALQVLNTQLSTIENISNPLSYYGGHNDDLHISYISDIHLLHHLNDGISLHSLVNSSIRNLYNTMDNRSIIVFVGDTSSDVTLTIDFYTKFVQYNDYLSYKKKKESLFNAKNKKISIDINKQKLKTKINRLKNYIKSIKKLLLPYLDFDIVARYKNRYCKDKFWIDAINAYKNVASYKNKNISSKCDDYLDLIASKLDLLEDFELQYDTYEFDTEKQQLYDFNVKTLYGKSIEDLTISDVYTEHHLLSDEREIFVVLGNHEYIGFNTVNDAVNYFKPRLEALGIKLLHNNYYGIEINSKTCVIFGGTGFAKYNPKYNADSLVCCNNFTRQDEIKESSLFEKAYLEAKEFASDKSCFVCVSHYPIKDCSATIDNNTIYFYGHNHQNFYHRNENEIIYADNQIGCKDSNIGFKTMTTGFELNPYFALDDGLYKTTIKDYLQFYKYIGEFIGTGTLLYQRCQNNKANMYVIKRKGYYGFFIMNPNKGTSKGISIVNGGQTKKITKSTDLQWLFDNFESVLYKYLQMLTPLRMYQEQISNELKQLGFNGTIHGCIVDVDFYHHIMLNPIDGTMTYYYSSSFGLVQPLASFENVIKSIQSHNRGLFSSARNYDLIQQQFNEKRQNQNYLLGKTNETNLLETLDSDIVLNMDVNEQIVSCSEGMYGISRRINSLQRLFSGHTLRDYDLKLVETEPILKINGKSKTI